MKTNTTVNLAVVLLLGLAAPATLAQMDLDWHTIDAGGELYCTGGTIELSGTIGQYDNFHMYNGDIEFYGGFWSITSYASLIGDMDCNGVWNFDDIEPFVTAMVDRDQYEALYDCNWYNADCNGDGFITFDDINAFIDLLVGAG